MLYWAAQKSLDTRSNKPHTECQGAGAPLCIKRKYAEPEFLKLEFLYDRSERVPEFSSE